MGLPADLAGSASPAFGDLTYRDAGTSIVEVIVSLLVFSVGLLAVLGVFTSSLTSLRDSRQRQLGTAEASRAVEGARTLRFDELANRGDAQLLGSWDPDGPGPSPAEAVHATATGRVLAAPFADEREGRALETFVTIPADSAHIRRVTAVVSWSSKGRRSEVRASTMISDIARGTTP